MQPLKPAKPAKPVRQALAAVTTVDNARLPVARPVSKPVTAPPPPPPSVPPPPPPTNSPPPLPTRNREQPAPLKSTNPFDEDVPRASIPVDPEQTPRNTSSNASGVPLRTVQNPAKKSSSKDKPATVTSTVVSTETKIRKPTATYADGKINKIYDKVFIAEAWLGIFLVIHVVQCTILLKVGYVALPPSVFIILLILMIAVGLCLIIGRYLIRSKKYCTWNLNITKPEDEAERELPKATIYLFCIASILEGLSLAIFSSIVAGRDSALPRSGNHYYNKATLLETLRFASISLLCLHRIIRPANRLDPARTMLEV